MDLDILTAVPILLAFAVISSVVTFSILWVKNRRLEKRLAQALQQIDQQKDRPNSVQLDEFLADVMRHGRGVLHVTPIRVEEILLRARRPD